MECLVTSLWLIVMQARQWLLLLFGASADPAHCMLPQHKLKASGIYATALQDAQGLLDSCALLSLLAKSRRADTQAMYGKTATNTTEGLPSQRDARVRDE